MVGLARLRQATASDSATGAAYVLAATIAWSFSGSFARLLHTDVMTAITLRSLFGGSFLLAVLAVLNGRRTLQTFTGLRGADWALVAAQGVCQAATVGAFYYTSIANTAVIYATAPFIAAGLAFTFVGERIAARTIVACAVAFIGVLVIVSNGFGSGHMTGDLIALLMTVTFALIIVIPKAYANTAMMPATALSGFLTAAAFAPFSHISAMPAVDWGTLALFGLTNFTVAMYLFLAGSRRITAAQAALIGTLEVVLAPLWAWLLFSERPSLPTVIGGGLILGVVVWHTHRDMEVERARAGSCLSP
jgi:drug/metabolite transporter (DMT)-like permease